MADTCRMIIFDMDGTLYSSEPFLYLSYQETIEAYNKLYNQHLPIPSKEDIMSKVGHMIRDILAFLLPDLNPDHFVPMSRMIMENILEKIRAQQGFLFPNCKKVLEELQRRSILITVGSNARFLYLNEIINTYQLDSYFEPIVALDTPGIQSKSDMARFYMERYSVPNHQVYFVGDRDKDQLAAEEVGIPFVWCSYGHAFPGEIVNPQYTIQSLEALLDLLK